MGSLLLFGLFRSEVVLPLKAMSTKKYVYYFGAPRADGNRDMKALLGGKGANLAEMVNLGIPVPPGFTISTEVCRIFQDSKEIPEEVAKAVLINLARVEKEIGKKFGDPANPLLFSVRSGAAASMPGMMDTVLNLGLNDEIVEAMAKRPGLDRFTYDSYRRFITMYSDIVMQIGREENEHEITALKHRLGIKNDSQISAQDLKELCETFKKIFKRKVGKDFPQNPIEQLFNAIKAVFRSWGNSRAVTYRRMYNITGLIGTAVNVQAMVFGNYNGQSATGVAFSRDPSTGENFFYGEYLINAQGEDVVAGIRTPQAIGMSQSQGWARSHNILETDRLQNYPSMEESMPECYTQLLDIKNRLEKHYRDMQDIEFTVEDGRLWMLQCRNAKRTVRAAVRCAVEMVKEQLIDEKEAVMRIDPNQVNHLLHPSIDPKAKLIQIAKGLAASPGAAVGQVVFSAEEATKCAEQGKKVVMVRLETSPEDLAGMNAAQGILTVRGGMTSHAAVVARGMGKTCVAGCGEIVIKGKEFFALGGKKRIKEGDWITLDGSKGKVYEGKAPLVAPSIHGDFDTILKWCRKFKRLGIRANADIPKDAKNAFDFGAEGVGLCRTEHMFFEGTRIDAMREMILADTLEGRKIALAKVLPLQRSDFDGIFRAMRGQPCTIRLLDPPLHEFVPHDEKNQADLALKIGITPSAVARRVKALHEENPMLGHRGVRLGISYPEIYNMQVQAIMEAAVAVKRSGIHCEPEIMIPLVGKREELTFAKKQCIITAEKVLRDANETIPYKVGTMIEVPRAAITADQIAQEAEFFSFGTNDLTQMGCGFSRDDAASFLRRYIELGLYERDPFETLDIEGVGELIRIAIRKGRAVNPLLKVGICGEHGGDPSTILFCHKVGMNYVSCSPFRVPVATVAAAHAAILDERRLAEERKRIAYGSKL